MRPYAKRADMPLAVHGEVRGIGIPHRVVRGEHYGHFWRVCGGKRHESGTASA